MRQQERIDKIYQEQLQQQISAAAVAEERNRLARELHDSIKQQLFSIRMSSIAALAQIEKNSAKAHEALVDIQQSALAAQVEMEALLQQMRSTPLAQASFVEAVQTQAQALEYRSGVNVQIELAELPALDRCPPSMREALFRIVQEAFTNIARHARAQQVECRLTHDDKTLEICIRDDGQGFDFQTVRKGMGLANIQERTHALNGTAHIESIPGKGTTLRVSIPLLLPAKLQQEQEQREQKALDIAAHARSSLQLRSTMAIFTLLILLIDVDMGLFAPGVTESSRMFVLFLLIFCLLLMVFGLVSARLALTRLASYRAQDDRERSALCWQERIGQLASLRLALFASWHLVIWFWQALLNLPFWVEGGALLFLAGLILALVLLAQHRLKYAQDRYYALLLGPALQKVVRRRLWTLRLRVILGVCVAISLCIHGWAPLFSPVLLWRWLASSFYFAFFIACLCLAIDGWHLRPWHKLTMAITQE